MKTILYHGSGFDQKELMPGFMRTGKLVKWDEVESNEWLYTTTDKDEAISQAFASMMEKTYNTIGYHKHGKDIEIDIDAEVKPSLPDMEKLLIFLYTIRLEDDDEWVKNANENNQIKTEWKTQAIIDRNIIHKEQIDLKTWLSTKNITFKLGDGPEQKAPNWLVW